MSERFQFLCIKYLDGTLNNQEVAELTHLVKENTEYQKEFVELMVQNSAIRNVLGSQNELENAVKETGKLKPFKSRQKYKSTRFQEQIPKQSTWPVIVLAAMVLLGIAVPMLVFKNELDKAQQSTPAKEIAKTKPITKEMPVVAVLPVKIIDVYGKVNRIIGENKEELVKDSVIKVGDQIETEFNSYVKFQTSQKSIIVLNENTNMEWKTESISLVKGDLYAEIKKKDIRSVYHFSTPQNSINIVGTAFEWSYSNNGGSILKVQEGVVEFLQNGEKKSVRNNQMLTSNDFVSGPIKIASDSIARWLNFYELFKKGFLFYIDEFKGDSFSSFWTTQSTQANNISTPMDGLICVGKNQKVELISKDLVLNGEDPLVFIFKARSIKAQNSFEYGYEIWNEKEMILHQGYLVTQINESSCHIKEVRNFGLDSKLKDEVLGPSKIESAVVENLPTISFNFTLTPSPEKVKEKVSYQKGVALADIQLGKDLKVVKIKFYVKTINETSMAQWSFDTFAIAIDKESTKKVFK